jgi:hypothetical protein
VLRKDFKEYMIKEITYIKQRRKIIIKELAIN